MYNPYVKEPQNQSYLAPDSPNKQTGNIPFYDSSYLGKQPQVVQMVPQIQMVPQYIIPMQPQPIQTYVVEPMQMSNIVYPTETYFPPPQKKHDQINWILYCWLILSLLVLLLINGIIFYHHLYKFEVPSEVNGIADFVIHNLKQDLIEDLKIINIGSSLIADGLNHGQSHSHIFSHLLDHQVEEKCQDGYTEIDAGQFHGINSGCICSNGQIHSKYVCWFKSSSQCSIVNTIKPHALKKWSNIKLCAKLIKEWKWVGSQACPDRMKLCQQGICIRTEGICPLSFLEQVTALPTDPQIKIMEKTYKFSRETSKRPIIGFSVTAGDEYATSLCFNSQKSPKFQSSKYYPLANQPQSGCTDEIHDDSITLEQQFQHEVYEQNNILKEMQDLPFWANYHSNTDTFHLDAVQRIRLRLHADCDQLNEKMIDRIKNQSSQLYSISKWFSVSLLTVTILTLLFVIISYVIKDKFSNLQQTKLIFAFTLICITLMITSYCIYRYQLQKKDGIQETHLLIDKFIAQKCFEDVPLQKMIKELKDNALNLSLQTEKYLVTGFYLSIVFLIVAIIMLVVQNLIFFQPICLDPWKQE